MLGVVGVEDVVWWVRQEGGLIVVGRGVTGYTVLFTSILRNSPTC